MDPDSDYYLQRAEAELTMAQAADHPAAVRAHYFLAGFYLDRVHASPPDISGTFPHPHLVPESGDGEIALR